MINKHYGVLKQVQHDFYILKPFRLRRRGLGWGNYPCIQLNLYSSEGFFIRSAIRSKRFGKAII